jgi:hypothetical protein
MADKPEMLPVDTRVSPALHPQNVHALEAHDDETAPYLAPTYDAFTAAYQGIASVFDARDAAKHNPTLNEAAQVIETQDYADRVFTRVAKAIDSVSANLKKGIEQLDKALSAPVEARAAHPLASEIRGHCKGLKTDERMSMIRNAIETGDVTTASSILGAPAYLSGINSDMQQVYIRQWHTKHNPEKAERLKAMKEAFELLGQRSGLVWGELEKAVGMKQDKVQALRDAKLNAEKILKTA